MKTHLKEKKQVYHLWTMLAESSSVDINTNNLSLHNLLEEFQVDVQVPLDKMNEDFVFPFKFEIVSLWQKSEKQENLDTNNEVLIDLVSPDGSIVQTLAYNLTIPKDKIRMRFRVNVTGIKLNSSGKYTFRVYLKGDDKKEMVAEAPLVVKVNKTALSVLK